MLLDAMSTPSNANVARAAFLLYATVHTISPAELGAHATTFTMIGIPVSLKANYPDSPDLPRPQNSFEVQVQDKTKKLLLPAHTAVQTMISNVRSHLPKGNSF